MPFQTALLRAQPSFLFQSLSTRSAHRSVTSSQHCQSPFRSPLMASSSNGRAQTAPAPAPGLDESDMCTLMSSLQKSVAQANTVSDAVVRSFTDLKRSVDDVKSDLSERLVALEERVGVIASSGASRATGSAEITTADLPSGTQPADVNPRLTHAISDVDENIMRVLSKRGRCVSPTLQWISILSVLSFIEHVPQVTSWFAPHERDRYKTLTTRLPGVSGLALLFFSKDPKDSNAHYKSRDGYMWTFMLRWVFSTMIVAGRKTIFQKSATREPTWLTSFGSPSDTVREIQSRLRDFERVSDSTPDKEGSGTLTASAKKRRRLLSDCTPFRTIDLSKELLCRIKSSILCFLTQNRRNVKLFLFDKLLFLIEKIQTFDDPAAARQAGYFIEMSSAADSEELMPIDEVTPDSVWNIPWMKSGPFDSDDPARDRENEEAFLRIQASFPSLSATLYWNKDVRRSPADVEKDHADYRDHSLKWPVSESVHLHDLAKGILMEYVRGKSSAQVLSSSTHSLMALHVLAIGLRALVQHSMGAQMTPAERAALGSVRARHRDTDEDIVSAYVGKSREDEGQDPHSTLQSARADLENISPGQVRDGHSSLNSVPGTPYSQDASQASTFRSPSRRTPSRSPFSTAPRQKSSNIQRLRSSKFEMSWGQYLFESRLSGATQTSTPDLTPACADIPGDNLSRDRSDSDDLEASASDIMNISALC